MKLYYDSDGDGSEDTLITNVFSFPTITSRLDQIGNCSFVIRDKLGALYSTWKDLDYVKFKIEDDNSNVIFRGYVTDKTFTHNSLSVTAKGIGQKLEWKAFNNNYVLAEGLVKTVPRLGDPDAIDLKQNDSDNDNPDFTWSDDQWHTDRDTGILIIDNTTGEQTVNWAATAVEDNGTATTEVGDHTSLADKHDAGATPYWRCIDANMTSANIAGLVTVTGTEIDSTKFLKRIRVHFNAALYMVQGGAGSIGSVGTLRLALEKLGDSGETYVGGTARFMAKGAGTKFYWIGVGEDAENVTYDDFVIEGTHAELAKYFTTDGEGDFTHLQLNVTLTGVQHADATWYMGFCLDYLTISVDYSSYDISPIMKTINDNGDTWIQSTGVTWAETGVTVDEAFKIGENTNQIISDVSSASGLEIANQSTLTKYIARWYKSSYCIDALEDICKLEGLHWWEDYDNDRIVVSKEADFVDSTVNLTNANYQYEWTIHDTPNQVKKVHVFGNAALRIYAFAEDLTSTSPVEAVVVNDKIMTVPDAQELADERLLELKNKRLQIEIPLQGLNVNLAVGKDVTLTMVNPTIAETDFPISKIVREKKGYVGTDDIWTTVYCGLGTSTLGEKIADKINQINKQTRRNAADRLVSTPYSTASIGTINWVDIAGKTAGVETIITAELVGGQSIDNAIDALIAATYTDAEINTLDDSHQAAAEATAAAALAAHHAGATDEHDGIYYTEAEVDAKISDAAYDATAWNNVTAIAPSKNTVRDAIVPLTNATVYRGTWSPRATYNFTEDENGTAPDGWTEADTGTTTSRVIASLGGREKVVHFNDDDAAGRCYIHRTFTQSADQSIEFWLRTSDNTKTFYIQFYEGATVIVYLVISGGFLKNHNGGWTNLFTMANDTWYRIKLDLDDTANTYDFYVDGIITAGVSYDNNSTTSIDRIWLYGEVAHSGYDVYFDAIMFSSEAGYPTEGDGFWYIVDQDGYAAADSESDTPARWYELGDWIVWNPTRNVWDILRNVQGDNVLKVSPGDDIQVAIDEIEGIGQGIVVLLPGTHVLTAHLNIGDILATINLNIEGQGDVSILDVGGDRECFDVNNCAQLTLKNFKIDANKLTTQAKLIVDVNAANDGPITIENVTISGDGTNGRGIVVNSKYVTVRNCRIDDVDYGIMSYEDSFIAYENYINSCAGSAIYCSGCNAQNIFDNHVEGNVEDTEYGIYFGDVEYSTINDNYVNDCETGILLVTQSDRNTIIGNTVLACSVIGINISAGDYNSITANVITGCGDGIELGANASNNYVTVNMVENSTGEDIDDDSDGTNYILAKADDIDTISLRVEASTGVLSLGLPYLNTQNGYFVSYCRLTDKIDISEDIIITWIMKREGVWTANVLSMQEFVGQCIPDGTNVINYTNIRNGGGSVLSAGANQDVCYETYTIAGGTVTAGNVLGIKYLHNDADNEAVTCLGCQVEYTIKHTFA